MTGKASIAVIPGDGIGVEVTAAAVEVLEAATSIDGGPAVGFEDFPWGTDHFARTGHMIEPGGVQRLRDFDAILFGACGSPDVPDHLTLWGTRLAVCQGMDQYVGLRPASLYPGVDSPLRSPRNFDMVVVRENTEGEYAGHGGRTHRGRSEVATQTAVFTRLGIERIVRYAFELACRRGKRVASITKSNAQQYAMVLWDEVVAEVASEYPDVVVDVYLVDAAAARLVQAPENFDVIVASNLFGDILSDIGGALMGSLGLAASGNIDPTREAPSMFEPVHGSAPDIAGRGIANPVGAMMSGAMLMEHLGFDSVAQRTRAAVGAALTAGAKTPDIGGGATTREVTTEVIRQLQLAGAAALAGPAQ